MLGTGTLFSPKAGLMIVKAAIQKTINQKVEDFDIIYKHNEKVIDFRLYNYTDDEKVFHEKLVVKYLDGEKLCGIIHNMLKEKTLVGDKIQFAIVNYKKAECKLLILTPEGKKITKIFSL